MKKFKFKLPEIVERNKLTFGLAAAILILVIGGFFGYKALVGAKKVPLQEIELSFDPDGPYGLILPRRDGNAINLNIKRVSSYEAINYELTYQSEGIDRGVQGDISTQDKKDEYLQEILFGTCSKGDTFSTLHCVFDKGVENGTLTLRIQKGNIVYKMITTWHMQKPDVALGILASADSHFTYKIPEGADLSVVGFSVVNDLSGVPKLPEGKEVLGKVYGLNVPLAKQLPSGDVSIELIQDAPKDAQIALYQEGKNAWQMLETKIDKSTLSTQGPGGGIYAVLVNSTKK